MIGVPQYYSSIQYLLLLDMCFKCSLSRRQITTSLNVQFFGLNVLQFDCALQCRVLKFNNSRGQNNMFCSVGHYTHTLHFFMFWKHGMILAALHRISISSPSECRSAGVHPSCCSLKVGSCPEQLDQFMTQHSEWQPFTLTPLDNLEVVALHYVLVCRLWEESNLWAFWPLCHLH